MEMTPAIISAKVMHKRLLPRVNAFTYGMYYVSIPLSKIDTRYAERWGMNVIKYFDDKAISGSSKDRPGFNAIKSAASLGEFNVLLVDDLSRLSRDEVEMKQFIRKLKFQGIRIIGVSDGYDSDTKGEKIQSTMRGLMNELYLDDLRDKTHRGLNIDPVRASIEKATEAMFRLSK